MSALLSFIGWAFLPSLVTSWLLTFYYRLITRAGDARPQPGSLAYANVYRRVNTAVIAIYLFYTIYESYYTLLVTPNFYTLLASPITASDREIKSKFRRLTVLYHPDKAGSQGEGYFVQLKQAYDVLADPVKRAAYERFGPDILGWMHCSSAYDYLIRGATMMVPYYLGGGLILIVLSVLGKLDFGRYWRFFTFFCLLVFEALVVTRPYNLFTRIPILRTLLPFEQLTLARKIVLTTSIAISQLGPLIQDPRGKAGPITVESLAPQLDRLAAFIQMADNEASAMLTQELVPFDSDPALQKQLRRKLQDWIVESVIRNKPEVRDAVGQVIQRRRADAPAGAKGTK